MNWRRHAVVLAILVVSAWATVWGGTFKDRFADRDFAIGVYQEHNEAVRREVPAERLIDFEVKQGWAPLCAFLGKPVPETPFPNVNDSAEFKRRIRTLKMIGRAPWVVFAIIAAIALYVALTSGAPAT